MDGQQQRTARQASDVYRYCFHYDQCGWYSCHLAPWLLVTGSELHKGNDHVHYNVHWHGGRLSSQPNLPFPGKSFES